MDCTPAVLLVVKTIGIFGTIEKRNLSFAKIMDLDRLLPTHFLIWIMTPPVGTLWLISYESSYNSVCKTAFVFVTHSTLR